jgi:hypothetical protein
MTAFKVAERIREVSTTTGTGTYTLGGSPTGYQPVSSLGANNYGPFYVTDGSNWEVIIGQYLTGPDRLTRDAVLASSNAGAAVNWGVGTRTIRCGPAAWQALPRYLTKSVAGGAGTTVLTQNEQRGQVLEFTGALTGNRIIEVDATPWEWTVYNNTTGAFSLTLRVTGQTGVAIPQTVRQPAYCDGTDVRIANYGEYKITRLFTSNGTWTKPTGLKRVRVTVIGGGASGGSGPATAAGQGSAGGGGGAGGTSIKTIEAATLGATETVTVGTGGGAAAAGGNGNAGNTSSFGAHCSATGGTAGQSGGVAAADTPAGQEGTGGGGGSGDVNLTGGAGSRGIIFCGGAVQVLTGRGGDGYMGTGGPGGIQTAGVANSNAGTVYGGGSSGSGTANGGAAVVTAAGSNGAVMVEEIY